MHEWIHFFRTRGKAENRRGIDVATTVTADHLQPILCVRPQVFDEEGSGGGKEGTEQLLVSSLPFPLGWVAVVGHITG